MDPTRRVSGSKDKGKGKRHASQPPLRHRLLLPGMQDVPPTPDNKSRTTTRPSNRPAADTAPTTSQGIKTAKINLAPRTDPADLGRKTPAGVTTVRRTPRTQSINDPAGKASGLAPPKMLWPGPYPLTPMNELQAGQTPLEMHTVGPELKFEQNRYRNRNKWDRLKKDYQLTVHVGPAVGGATAGSSDGNLVFWVTIKHITGGVTTLVHLSAEKPPDYYLSGTHNNMPKYIPMLFHAIVPPQFTEEAPLTDAERRAHESRYQRGYNSVKSSKGAGGQPATWLSRNGR